MAHNTDSASPRKSTGKRKKVSSPTKTTGHGVALTKEKKRRLVRRISSSQSGSHREAGRPDDDRLPLSVGPPCRDREAPTFYQPPDPQRQMRYLERPGDVSNSAEVDQDEDEPDLEATLEHLQKLPENERNRTFGKIFALKVW